MNTKKIYLLLCGCCISITLFSQKKDVYLHELENLSRYNYIDTDTARIWITESIPDLLIFTLSKKRDEDDFFITDDTLHRDYILLRGEKYLVDSLWLKEYDNYAMLFEYLGVYAISDKKSTYLIINGSNGFQIGTEAQMLYAIFQKKADKYIFLSSYYIEETYDTDNSEVNSVKIIFDDDKITLQGKNLKCIHCK